MPVLPGLLPIWFTRTTSAHYGILLALYALMQFACAPVLGALSDRFGRRPVLLVSLAGAAVDYAIMATAPFLWVLYIGRIVAGITGATGAVAGAYIADITDGDERARHFGFRRLFRVRDGRGTCARWADGGFSPHARSSPRQPWGSLNFLTGCFRFARSRTKAGAGRYARRLSTRSLRSGGPGA